MHGVLDTFFQLRERAGRRSGPSIISVSLVLLPVMVAEAQSP